MLKFTPLKINLNLPYNLTIFQKWIQKTILYLSFENFENWLFKYDKVYCELVVF